MASPRTHADRVRAVLATYGSELPAPMTVDVAALARALGTTEAGCRRALRDARDVVALRAQQVAA